MPLQNMQHYIDGVGFILVFLVLWHINITNMESAIKGCSGNFKKL